MQQGWSWSTIHLLQKSQDVDFVQTVQDNFEDFTKKDIAAAKVARESHGMIGQPSERKFKSMVSNNIIQNFPITASGISNDRNMFGPNLAVTRNKTVQKNPDR